MPTSSPSPDSRVRTGAQIDRLDFDANRLRIPSSTGNSQGTNGAPSRRNLRDDASFFSDVVEGVIERDRRKMSRTVTRYIAFASAILSCLCAGSITAYSLYGPLFLRHLRYSQYQVNAVSTTAEIAIYLPVPLVGWLCDRYNPRPLAAFSGVAFGLGYFLAAGVYRAGPIRASFRTAPNNSSDVIIEKQGWPFEVMIFAFVCIGFGTCCMYLTAVTTCVKNFGRGKHKGIALAMPIAAFGLSGMWQSLVGSHFFADPEADGHVDVFRYFLFLGGLLFAVGLVASVCLRVVGEEEMIEEGVEELEHNARYEETRSLLRREVLDEEPPGHEDYGTLAPHSGETNAQSTASLNGMAHHDKPVSMKTRLLNAETLLFLSDPTAYLLAAGFFLASGPGEAYINNIGTLVQTLYPPSVNPPPSNSPAIHVSVVALTSTLARLATGALADLFAPTGDSVEDDTSRQVKNEKRSCSIPRPALLLGSTVVFFIGQLLLATPVVQQNPSILPLNTAFVGFGYGAIFSLTPMIISVVWGVQNFGTNWGIVALMPAGGAAVWGAIYSAVYSGQARKEDLDSDLGGEECYGSGCYQLSFGAMAISSCVAIALWAYAWRGWRRRKIVV